MAVHSIQVSIPPKDIFSSTLRLGGQHPNGDRISFTNYYMQLNDRPFFAICGEFHYSRYPESQWVTELRKMKSSGINVVATYIFWNHHEELEGQFEWQDNRNLRRFIEYCDSNDLYLILRVGPFCHGEVRNGGIPDWMFGRAFDVRSNDEEYLRYVSRLYQEIGQQAQEFMYKEGGPVIGIQLENEFQASAALWELTAKQGDEYMSGGSGGEEHMRRLKSLALDAGLDTPLVTSTGWGGAPVLEDEVLTLYGGYAYTPWTISEQHPHQQPTHEYRFVSYHDDHAVIPDFNPPYPRTKYPFACCEMGGGMQSWYLSRFQVEPESAAAMSLVKIACGCNFIGYYMFHGGTNPVGRTDYMNESTTPKITYDFQAPIGEFGQIRASNHLLRQLHYFLQQFGEQLAPLAVVLPDEAESITPENTEALRYALRTDGNRGFLFINNYQDHVKMQPKEDVRFTIECANETISFPRGQTLTVEPNAAMLLPFNFTVGDWKLRYATAQPVTALEDDEVITYFFKMLQGINGEFLLAADQDTVVKMIHGTGSIERDGEHSIRVTIAHEHAAVIEVSSDKGKRIWIYMMTADEASRLWVTETGGGRRIFFTEHALIGTPDGIELFSSGSNALLLQEYRRADGALPLRELDSIVGSLEHHQDALFDYYDIQLQKKEFEFSMKRMHQHKVALQLDMEALEAVDDVILNIDYIGNVGYAFSRGQLIHDNFYNGTPWELGLARFKERIHDGEIVLETTPLRVDAMPALANPSLMGSEDEEEAAVFRSITAEPVYRVRLTQERSLNKDE